MATQGGSLAKRGRDSVRSGRTPGGAFSSANPSVSPERDNSTVDPTKGFLAVFESYDLKNWANTSVQVQVAPNGVAPLFFVNLFRHPATSAALKETAAKEVFCFLGNYIGTYVDSAHSTDSGRIGLVYTADTANLVLVSKGPFPQTLTGSGTIIGGQLNIHLYDNRVGGHDFIFTGYISGKICHGNWQRPNSTAVGQFNIQRTL